MQTFLPYPNFVQSAEALDMQRLGKQRVETLQILKALFIPDYGWRHHPAVKMWKGHETHLLDYGFKICEEWVRRGYKDTCSGKLFDIYKEHRGAFSVEDSFPEWLTESQLCSSHRAALLAKAHATEGPRGLKLVEWYGKFGWKEEPKLDYFWPIA